MVQEVRVIIPLRHIEGINLPAFCREQAKASFNVGIHLYRLEEILLRIGIIMDLTFYEVKIMYVPFDHLDIDLGNGILVKEPQVIPDC